MSDHLKYLIFTQRPNYMIVKPFRLLVALTVRKTDTNWVQYRQVAIFPIVKLFHH